MGMYFSAYHKGREPVGSAIRNETGRPSPGLSSRRYINDGLPSPKVHPQTADKGRVITTIDASTNNIVNAALRETMDPVLPYRLEWRADNEKRSGKPDSRLCRVPTDGGGEGFWTSDKIIEGKKEPWFRVMAALLMKALDGGDGIWLGVDDQAEVTMTGDFGVVSEEDRVRRVLSQVVNELVTRKASEILIMNYSFGFVLRLSQKETLGNGDIRFHLKASPMAGHEGQVVDFRPNGRDFEPIYKHASLLTDKVLGPRRAFGLPSSPSED